MKNLRRRTIIICTLFTVIEISAQKAIVATENDAIGSGGSSSYTIGQVLYTTNTGTNGSVAQGIQQPYEISIPLGEKETEINLELVTYPNPTNTDLTLNIGNYKGEKLTYQLYDIKGKLQSSKQISKNNITIGMKNLPTNIYLLNILDNNSLIKTFKIIKN